MIDPDSIDAITFDCFGTLIDWPAGILSVLRPLADRYRLEMNDAELLAHYAALERDIQARGFTPYRDVLARVMRSMFGTLAAHDADALAASIASWRPFPDTLDALKRLATRYRLGVLSNIDDDLFAPILETLGHPFEVVVTAQQVQSYKPAEPHFAEALRRLDLKPQRVLHAAESRFHDIDPARRLGMHTAWINRGQSASGPSDAAPDAQVPDVAALADILSLPRA